MRYAACFAAALGCHAAVLFAIHAESGAKALALGETESAVELALVEAAPALEQASPPAEPPPPEPLPPPEPKPPDPVPPEPVPPPEPSIPEPVVQPVPTREPPKPQPATKPKSAPRAASTPAPRRAPPAASASAASGTVGAISGKPGAGTPASGTNTKLRARYNPRPAYPAESRRLKQAGVVLIAAQVNAQGVPTSVSLSRSSGFPLLDQAALAAVRRWRFEPSRVAGVAVAGNVDCPVRFNLQN